MKNKSNLSAAVAGTLLASSAVLAGIGSAYAAGTGFGATELHGGYMQVADGGKGKEGSCGEGKCGGDKDAKGKEGACGEGKCGGEKKAKGKEGACGEGKCGGEKKTKGKEGACGEGKCGAGKAG